MWQLLRARLRGDVSPGLAGGWRRARLPCGACCSCPSTQQQPQLLFLLLLWVIPYSHALLLVACPSCVHRAGAAGAAGGHRDAAGARDCGHGGGGAGRERGHPQHGCVGLGSWWWWWWWWWWRRMEGEAELAGVRLCRTQAEAAAARMQPPPAALPSATKHRRPPAEEPMLGRRIEELEALAHAQAGRAFNVGSPQEVRLPPRPRRRCLLLQCSRGGPGVERPRRQRGIWSRPRQLALCGHLPTPRRSLDAPRRIPPPAA